MNDLIVIAIITACIFIFAMLFGFYATSVLLIILLAALILWATDEK